MSISRFTVPKITIGSRGEPSSQQPQTSLFTDEFRDGSEYCPYCGGYHSTDAERSACARAHSSAGTSYRCPRCGAYHSTLDAAEHCCDADKRFEREYDPTTYAEYTDGYSSGTTATGSYYSGSSGASSSGGSGEGIFSSLFNFGSNKDTEAEQSSSGGGLFDSFFNAGGGSNKKSGGGFFG